MQEWQKYSPKRDPIPKSPKYVVDIATIRYSNAPTMRPDEEEAFTESMLNVLIPTQANALAKAIVEVNIETQQWKKDFGIATCTSLPPTYIEPQRSNLPIAVGKMLWVIDPEHPDIVAVVGKT